MSAFFRRRWTRYAAFAFGGVVLLLIVNALATYRSTASALADLQKERVYIEAPNEWFLGANDSAWKVLWHQLRGGRLHFAVEKRTTDSSLARILGRAPIPQGFSIGDCTIESRTVLADLVNSCDAYLVFHGCRVDGEDRLANVFEGVAAPRPVFWSTKPIPSKFIVNADRAQVEISFPRPTGVGLPGLLDSKCEVEFGKYEKARRRKQLTHVSVRKDGQQILITGGIDPAEEFDGPIHLKWSPAPMVNASVTLVRAKKTP